MSVIYRAFKGLAAGAAALSAANAAAIDLAAFVGAGGDLSPTPVCRCAAGGQGKACEEADSQETSGSDTEPVEAVVSEAADLWPVLALRSE